MSGSVRILIADDNATVRQGVAQILESETKHEICGVATDGPEAIDMARELAPDLVLLDVSMPGMDGLEAARAIVKTEASPRIIIMSMHDPAHLLPRAQKAGACACIDKSMLFSDLVPMIKSVLEMPRPEPDARNLE